MKNHLLFALLAAASFGAQASCSINSVQDKQVSSAFDKHGGWNFEAKQYDALCQKLRANRARLNIQAMSSVLGERSIGWAALSLLDQDSAIGTTSFGSLNTVANTYASDDKAAQIMVQAINNAASDWAGIDQALAALEAERKRVRDPAARGAKAAPPRQVRS